MTKYVIVWYDSTGTFSSYWMADHNTKVDDLFISWWCGCLEKATVFNRSQAEKMYKTLAEYYKKNFPNTWFGAKIVEYIPPQLGSELLSERDQVIADLKRALTYTHSALKQREMIMKAIEFLEKENNNG